MLLSRILLQSTAVQPWSNLGPAISANYIVDFPNVISMNADGTVIAWGNWTYGPSRGIAEVFAWNGTTWNQRGASWIGTSSPSTELGRGVSLNGAGDRIAICLPYNIGVIRVYQWNSSAWTQLGNDMIKEEHNDQPGFVKLNSIGNRLIMGVDTGASAGTNTGYVKMFQLNGSTWSAMGSRINGEVAWDLVGQEISMNAAGDVIAFSSKANTSYSGYVKVFYWNNTSWVQRGSTIRGVPGQYMGSSVALNGAGDILAITAYAPERVQVLQWNGSSWVEKGNPMYEPASTISSSGDTAFGGDIALNTVGDKIVIGSWIFNGQKGRASVFSWDGNNWNLYGLSMEGSLDYQRFGTWVAMSSAGNIIALSSKVMDSNYDDRPKVDVFKYN